jgi:hypothetical protein
MRIVALDAVGRGEGLVLVSLLQVRILGIVAIEAERRGRLGEMERLSIVGSAPVLWVTWQVSQPMSSAAWRLPFRAHSIRSGGN